MRWNRATVSVWVNEQTCPMCSFPLTVSGGVSMAYTSPRDAERSNLYYARVLPPARPLVLDAVKRGLVRHEAGLGRLRRLGVGTHAARLAKRWSGGHSAFWGRPRPRWAFWGRPRPPWAFWGHPRPRWPEPRCPRLRHGPCRSDSCVQ